MAGQRRIQELAGGQPAEVGEHDEGDAEFVALGPMHRQAVGQLERVAAFVSELAAVEPVLRAQLRDGLHPVARHFPLPPSKPAASS